MKVLALVRFNSSIAIVFDEILPLVYQKKNDCILGSNGFLLQTYFLDHCSKNWQAFAGRKFDLTMEDGEVIHCEGQWWYGIKDTHRQMVDGNMVHATAAAINDLKECYVFIGYGGIEHRIKKLISEYKGIIYDYWDYEMLITKNKYRRKKSKLIPVLRKIRRLTNKRKALFNK